MVETTEDGKPPREASESVVLRLQAALKANQAIPYDSDRPDKEYPGVKWSTYGLIATNEMVVVARYELQQFAIAGKSWLIYPFMADRIFGMDMDDRTLCEQLTHELWPTVQVFLNRIGKH